MTTLLTSCSIALLFLLVVSTPPVTAGDQEIHEISVDIETQKVTDYQNEGTVRRCWTCRSRGEYGDCRDPFLPNLHNLDLYPQVDAAPCASGWCGKVIEGNEIQYSVATERLCLQRPPQDGQERCAETQWRYQKVYMCFCMGDLCNGVSTVAASLTVILTAFIINRIIC